MNGSWQDGLKQMGAEQGMFPFFSTEQQVVIDYFDLAESMDNAYFMENKKSFC